MELLRPASEMYRQTGWREVLSDRLGEVKDLMDEVYDTSVRVELEEQWSIVHKSMFYAGRQTWIR